MSVPCSVSTSNDSLRLPMRVPEPVLAWFYGFAPPERGAIVLGHRRVYIVPGASGSGS
mgnify:CR=1 FL=1